MAKSIFTNSKNISYAFLSLFFLFFLFNNIILINALPHDAENNIYSNQQQNTYYNLIVSSDNATNCNLTYIQIGNNVNNINLGMNRNIQDFSILVSSGNFTGLNNVCMGITCYGSGYETGSKCLTVTPTGGDRINSLGIFIILLIVSLLILAIAVVMHNGYVGFIAGALFIVTGVYSMIYGVGNLSNVWTQAISYVVIGIGFMFEVSAGYEIIGDVGFGIGGSSGEEED